MFLLLLCSVVPMLCHVGALWFCLVLSWNVGAVLVCCVVVFYCHVVVLMLRCCVDLCFVWLLSSVVVMLLNVFVCVILCVVSGLCLL